VVNRNEKLFEGAQHIIADGLMNRTDVRNQLRHQLEKLAQITPKVVGTKKTMKKAQKIPWLFEWSEALKPFAVAPISWLILRAEKWKVHPRKNRN